MKICRIWTTSQVLRRPNVKTPQTGQYKENRWQWFGPPEGCELKRHGHSDYLSLCMYVRVRTCVRLRAYMAPCLPFCHPGDGGTLFHYINLSECPHLLRSVSVFVCLSVCHPWHPVSWSATNLLSSLLKICLVSKNNLTILNMLSVYHAFFERFYLCDFNRNLCSQGR